VLKPVFARLGWDQKPDENVLDTMLRPQIISALGAYGDQDVIAEGKKRFALWLKTPASLKPDLVGSVVTIVMRDADEKTWKLMTDKIRNTQSTEIKLRLFSAVAAARDPELVKQNAKFAWSGALPAGRIDMALALIANESEQPDLVWDIVKANEKEVRSKLAPWSQDRLLPNIVGATMNPVILAALKDDPAAVASTGGRVETARALDRANARIETSKVLQAQLKVWLASQSAQ
jgi:aminopeptidase N